MAHFLCHLGCSHFGALLLDFYFTENTDRRVLWYGDFRIQRKNQLTVPLKYLILVLLLMDFFHTFILSEKTRFGYPFVVPYLVFFVGVFCNAPKRGSNTSYLLSGKPGNH